jgi:Holliday junction resolvase RusA-like endonuclease
MTLPLPPSVNHRYIVTKYGVVLAPEVRAYQEEVAMMVEQMVRPLLPDKPLIAIYAEVTFTNRRRDLDNVLKALIDGVCLGLGVDDSRVYGIEAWKLIGKEPKVDLFVRWRHENED